MGTSFLNLRSAKSTNSARIYNINNYRKLVGKLGATKLVRNIKLQIILIAVFVTLAVFGLAIILKESLEVIYIGCMITAIIIGVSYFVHKKYHLSNAIIRE